MLLRYLVLKSPAVMPMYIFFSWLLEVLVATSALYTMLSVRHFLASGQLAGFWQLHVSVSFFVGVGITPTPTKNDTLTCNCQKPANCPLAKKCLTESIVYKAEVATSTSNNQEKKIYIGITAGDFKTRYRNNTKSFRHEEYKNNTELSKYVLKLKSENSQYTIKWSIMNKVKAYKPGSKRCNLCLEEKLLIMKAKKTECLNKRSDLFSKM